MQDLPQEAHIAVQTYYRTKPSKEDDCNGVFNAEDEFDAIDAFIRSSGTALDLVPERCSASRLRRCSISTIVRAAGVGSNNRQFRRLQALDGALKACDDDRSRIAPVGLCRGNLAEIPNESEIQGDFRLL